MKRNTNNKFLVLIRRVAILLPVFFCASAIAKNFAYQFEPDDLISHEAMQLENISSLGISRHNVNKLPVTELSGLAWDAHKKLLYAVSDSGYLYHLKLTIKHGKLLKATVLRAYKLRDKKGNPFRGKYRDSEGLTLKRNNKGVVTELIISFERKFRIVRFDLQGQQLGKIKLPKVLRKKKHYQSTNKGLESVTLHPKYGLITAAEKPLKTAPKNVQTLYSSKGKVWHFKLSVHRNSSVTGLETLPNGDVLVLERSYNGLFAAMIISLRQVKLTECNQLGYCQVEELAVFNSIDGWRVDNFEGLTHYQGNQYLMVSDDNENPMQNTVLVLFNIKHLK
ncbi:MAG TPA: esterase-like activity of phytase family protein [Leucothrix mucor]|uniref:Esterase-like activity of phytase family protein n=1 Tax=Leucothrix mucor TaxID=45248 RepID=A0A7V2WU94_LEUMU|nr:esterase-like activity of phytase family protein [Leucothrix mucor]